MDRFEDLRCFVAVAEMNSVTRAAEHLALAPSAVSRRLKELEHRLGAQLLSRTTRRMSLTEAGQGFYTRCQQILKDLEEAETEVADASSALSGTLRLAAPLTFGIDHLAPIVSRFMAEHPELDIDLDLSDRVTDLVGEGFDLAVRIGSLRDSSLIARRLCDIRMVVCASPDWIARHGPLEDPQQIKGLPALCYSGSERADIWRYTGPDGEEDSVQVAIHMRANNGTVLALAAAEGHGVVIEPSFIVHRQIAAGDLVPLFTSHSWPVIGLHTVYPQTRHLSAKARAFIDFMRASIGPKPYWEEGLAGA